MNGSTRSFLRDLGKLLHIPAFLAVGVLPVILYFGEWFALLPFGVMALLSVVVGQLLYRPFRKAKEPAKTVTLPLVALVWLLLPISGIIPFYGTAISAPSELFPAVPVFSDPLNAFFESMSGYTGTGLTMVENPHQLPHTLQWWRSLLEWVGGIGIIMVASVLLDLSHDTSNLYKAETNRWTIKDATTSKTIKNIWMIYLSYTMASFIAFYLAGMPPWEALNHSLVGISTGGFAVTPNSFQDYSHTIKITAIVIIIAGALNYRIHYLLLVRHSLKQLLKQTELHYFLFILVAASFLILWINPGEGIVDNLFQTVSALGTCGFNSAELAPWPVSPLFLLTALMVFGGNSSSTAGGLKTSRIAWLVKSTWRQLKSLSLSRKEEVKISFNGRAQDTSEANNSIIQVGSILLLWLVSLGLGTLAMSLLVGDQYPLHQILFDISSALNNVGLSAGVTGADLPGAAKLLLAALMWVGRLEAMAVLLLLFYPVLLLRKKG